MINIFSNWFKKEKTASSSKILFTSIPKCGTHLLLRYFDYVGFKCGGPYDATFFKRGLHRYVQNLENGSYSAFHYPWTKELSDIVRSRNIKVVFLYRDPRAQICSRIHFILSTPSHCLHKIFKEEIDFSEGIRLLIEGFPPEIIKKIETFSKGDFDSVPVQEPGPDSKFPRGINGIYQRYFSWFKEINCYPVRFEDVVGFSGGGDAEKQLKVVRDIMDFTGVPNGKLTPQEVADALFDKHANTFRKGQIDSWRKEFTPELHDLFMREAGGLLKIWGYS